MMTVASPRSSSEQIRAEFLASGDACAVLRDRSAMVDALVQGACREILAPVFPQGLAVLAVGGFGRRELFPFSDVDLLVLVEKDLQEPGREALSAFLRTLWDKNLRLSHSVRSVAECCTLNESNVELSVSLLDQRLLAGDQSLYAQLEARLPKFFRAQKNALIRHLCDLTRERHAKFHGTIYHLEPNIKETPGGVRDLHVIQWLSGIREAEDWWAESLGPSRRFLSELRCKLHYMAGRDSNVLSFDAQDQFAANPAEWMREYYRHARAIQRTALRQMEVSEGLTEGSLVKQFRDWRTRLSNAEFTVSRDRVFFKVPQQIAQDSGLVFRLFQMSARHGIRLAVESERRVAENLPSLASAFQRPAPVWPMLAEILSLPHAAMAVRAMHETGFLTVLFPEWEQIECLVIRDFYHRYTVDEHTLVTLEALEELRNSKDPERRRFVQLLEETDQLPLLSMALLFHDTGKGEGLAGHAAESAKLAQGALDRLHMPPEQAQTVVFLIENHLQLSSVMNSRDLSDPATAQDIADRVG
ncbi:MAG: hypothetical protein ACRD7E_16790, partial [Bryobacteraceae bacterium]